MAIDHLMTLTCAHHQQQQQQQQQQQILFPETKKNKQIEK